MAKLSKGAAYYRVADDPAQSCATCRYFRKRQRYENGTCDLVAGVIEPEDTCNLWVAVTQPLVNWALFVAAVIGAYLLAKGPRQRG